MVESLRGRLILWYAVGLALVVSVFGVTVCLAFWRSIVARADDELRQRASAVAVALRPAGSQAFDLDLPDATLAYFREAGGASYAIWNAAGDAVDASDPDHAVPPPPASGARTREGRREVAVPGPAGTTVLVGRSLQPEWNSLRALALNVAAAAGAALGLSVVAGWLLVGRALAPIARINRTARAMANGDLAARIAVDRTESELDQVGIALNTAFDRLNAAVERQRRFTADASHELRTPLATLLAETEWALARPRTADQYREALATCRAAAMRTQSLVEGLLTLARADADELPLARVPVALAELAREVVALVRPLAGRRGIRIDARLEPVVIEGDADRLRDALTNVLGNAIQYNRDGGRVDLAVRTQGAEAVVRVADTGTGIEPEHLPHIFERFYRVDTSRRGTGGAGLGLAVTRWIVEAHGGTIHCTSEPGRGTEFELRFPAVRAAGEDGRPEGLPYVST